MGGEEGVGREGGVGGVGGEGGVGVKELVYVVSLQEVG